MPKVFAASAAPNFFALRVRFDVLSIDVFVACGAQVPSSASKILLYDNILADGL